MWTSHIYLKDSEKLCSTTKKKKTLAKKEKAKLDA